MIKLEKMSYKQPELDLIAEWRNQSMISLRSNDLTAKGEAQRKWVDSFTDREKYYFIYNYPFTYDEYWNSVADHYNFNYEKSKKLVGYCGLDKIDSVNKTAEMSLLINPVYHKKGYGSTVVKELLRMAFEDFNLNCVFIEVISSTHNWEFWRKQGFIHEGTLLSRYYKKGSFYNSDMGSYSKRRWEFHNNKDK